MLSTSASSPFSSNNKTRTHPSLPFRLVCSVGVITIFLFYYNSSLSETISQAASSSLKKTLFANRTAEARFNITNQRIITTASPTSSQTTSSSPTSSPASSRPASSPTSSPTTSSPTTSSPITSSPITSSPTEGGPNTSASNITQNPSSTNSETAGPSSVVPTAIYYANSRFNSSVAPSTTSPDDVVVYEYENCCLFRLSKENLVDKFTPEYFQTQTELRQRQMNDDTPLKYTDWLMIQSIWFPPTTTIKSPTDHVQTISLNCQTQWSMLVMNENDGQYLFRHMANILNMNMEMKKKPDTWFPYVEGGEQPSLPRILQLGDSISQGIWEQTNAIVASLPGKKANIRNSPANCKNFNRYKEDDGLLHWLGDCPWDLVQFNVGQWFRPTNRTYWQDEYEHGFRFVVTTIREHSPQAKIVFALTTPSPFDSNATYPDEATCPNYDKFHKQGFIPALNDFARSLADELGDVHINDRFSAILPTLGKYQRECDIHYHDRGYTLMAQHDWFIFSSILNLE
jgi:hypothetical protein